MDKRSLLLGLGMGMIIGALLMQLFLLGEQSTNQLKEMDQTINTIDFPPAQTPAAAKQEAPAEPDTNAPITDDAAPKAEDEQAVNSDAVHAKESDEEHADKVPVASPLLLRVLSGATVSETASIMELNGIIASKDSFIKLTKTERKNIRAGYFLVETSSSDEKILQILTSIPIPEAEALAYVEEKKYNIIFSPQTE